MVLKKKFTVLQTPSLHRLASSTASLWSLSRWGQGLKPEFKWTRWKHIPTSVLRMRLHHTKWYLERTQPVRSLWDAPVCGGKFCLLFLLSESFTGETRRDKTLLFFLWYIFWLARGHEIQKDVTEYKYSPGLCPIGRESRGLWVYNLQFASMQKTESVGGKNHFKHPWDSFCSRLIALLDYWRWPECAVLWCYA